MVAIVDYGVGNLFSLECSLNAIGAQVVITADPEVLKKRIRYCSPVWVPLRMRLRNCVQPALTR